MKLGSGARSASPDQGDRLARCSISRASASAWWSAWTRPRPCRSRRSRRCACSPISRPRSASCCRWCCSASPSSTGSSRASRSASCASASPSSTSWARLTRDEVGDYLAHRLAVAGYTGTADLHASGGARDLTGEQRHAAPDQHSVHKSMMLAYRRGQWHGALAPRARGHHRYPRRAPRSCLVVGWPLAAADPNRMADAAMSVINKMLQDLDSRNAAPGAGRRRRRAGDGRARAAQRPRVVLAHRRFPDARRGRLGGVGRLSAAAAATGRHRARVQEAAAQARGRRLRPRAGAAPVSARRRLLRRSPAAPAPVVERPHAAPAAEPRPRSSSPAKLAVRGAETLQAGDSIETPIRSADGDRPRRRKPDDQAEEAGNQEKPDEGSRAGREIGGRTARRRHMPAKVRSTIPSAA